MNQKQQQEDFKMTATTLKGLESVLAGELRSLGAKEIKESIRSVSFRGDLGFLYKANIALRTAIRILKPIKTGKYMMKRTCMRSSRTLNGKNI